MLLWFIWVKRTRERERTVKKNTMYFRWCVRIRLSDFRALVHGNMCCDNKWIYTIFFANNYLSIVVRRSPKECMREKRGALSCLTRQTLEYLVRINFFLSLLRIFLLYFIYSVGLYCILSFIHEKEFHCIAWSIYHHCNKWASKKCVRWNKKKISWTFRVNFFKCRSTKQVGA